MKHTPGPWGWFGNSSNNSLYLATIHGGRKFVMDFTRWGMRGAQPRFQIDSVMVDAKDLAQFEVGDQSIIGHENAKSDGGVYRYDIRGISHADAILIAAAPELLEALETYLSAGCKESRRKASIKAKDAITRATQPPTSEGGL